jgi:hypothetical protein
VCSFVEIPTILATSGGRSAPLAMNPVVLRLMSVQALLQVQAVSLDSNRQSEPAARKIGSQLLFFVDAQ